MKTLTLTLALLTLCAASARAEFKAGAAVIDVTPPTLPVLVNGGMISRTVSNVNTRVNARAIALGDGKEQCVIVVVDSCMMGRPLLDEAKALTSKRTGIATNRMLISATHAHSAPASMGCLGTDADPRYVPFLRDKIAEAIAAAQKNLEPARVGFAKGDAGDFTALRQWIRRPDRLAEDPFGNMSVRANMHAGRKWDDVTGEAGPKDPDISIISIQSRDGRPIAVLGNFSMHYFGDRDISADYFGLFAEGLRARIAPEAAKGKPPFVGIMSHGCSGDIYRTDYKIPEKDRPKPTIDEYTKGLLDIAMTAYAGIKHRADADVAMAERRMTLNYRVPDKQRLEWAQRTVAAMTNALAKTPTEVYAREQIILNERQRTEIVVQALRIGDIGIATTPCETYAVTGLKIKAASPLAHNIVIELANGGDGYIPPPEQHPFGGYNTWAARSAGLEVQAEPKIAEAAINLLEKVSGQPRRAWKLADGPAARAILNAKPAAYWRLNEFTGPHAADATGHGHDAVYEPGITYYLEGPRSTEFCAKGDVNRAPHFVGGRVRARLDGLGDRYSVSLWLWNGMPNDGRDVSGWLFSRGRDHGLGAFGDHLGIGGRSAHTGRLIFFHGDDAKNVAAGKTEIPRWQWQHVVLVRDAQNVRVYLNGQLEMETKAAAKSPAGLDQLFFGGRSDNDSNWEGRLDEIALFSRALSAKDVARLEVK
ncbi:MAG: hypothetical protein HY301_01470 [Verrucomicrobia bacterium]|nr:hypothetical protein [Verrucomicrobiota bacterium]